MFDAMHILHILDHSLPIHSGYAFRTAEILKFQERLGWQVTALTGPKHDKREESGDLTGNIEYLRAPYTPTFDRLPGLAKQLGVITILRNRIIELAESYDFDILHAHSPSLNGLAAVAAGRRLGIPVVYEMRASWEDAAVDHGTARAGGLRYHLTKATETMALRWTTHVTTICEGLKAEISARGVPGSSVTVIPNGVDTERFRPTDDSLEELREKYDVDGRFVLVFCGSYYSYEGLGLLVEAMARLKDSRPDILLLLAGGGEQEATLRRLVSERGLQDQVRFLGRVPQSSVVDLYNLSNVCIFPRRRMKLTEMVTPLKPLEAMATGAVVLASDVGGHRELIQNDETGFLFPADDVGSLVNAVTALSTRDRQDLDLVGDAACRFVSEERGWQKIVSKYTNVYSEALGNTSSC